MKDLTNQLGTYSYASEEEFLAGRPFSAVLQRGDPYAIFVEKNVGGFFQDDWQLKPNLSLSAGLRYDWQNNFGDINNFAPRLAFAYAPRRSREWVLRAGAGFFFERSGPGPVWDILRYDGQHLRRYVITDPRLLPPARGVWTGSRRVSPGWIRRSSFRTSCNSAPAWSGNWQKRRRWR